jgi:SAM-dependent methyltransferase
VTAFDQSELGVAKARALATEMGVTPEFHVTDIKEWDWTRTYDVVVAVFIQFAPPDLRDRILRWLGQAVAPGGMLLLHGYVPRQVEYGTGGPPDAANMYTPELLEGMFDGFEILRLEEYDWDVDEGRGHSGRSALIDLVARKPAKG